MLFTLDLANNTILSYFFLFFFLIPVVIEQNFNTITKLVTPIRIPIKEAQAEIEIHPVTVEAKKKVLTRKC